MKSRLLMALCVPLLLLFSACAAPAEPISGVGYYFDTVVTITLSGGSQELLTELWQACGRYERLLSKTIDGSDIDRINRAGGQPVAVDPETWAILRRAKEISAMTDGAFRVTIAPLSALWDFTSGAMRMPTDQERLAALPLTDDSRLILGDGGTVTLPAGMQLDLGGIAKGYIADQLARMVREQGATGTLNFGGNVYAVGAKDGGSPYRIGIADPAQPGQAIAVVSVRDASVVTSGTYERCFTRDGVTYHHILNPATGLPADTGIVSATIVSASSMDADALATACVVLGREKALALLEREGYDGLLIDAQGEAQATKGFAERYGLALR